VVHRQLWRDAPWHGRPDSQSGVNDNLLRQDEEQRHWQRERGLCVGDGNSKRAAGSPDIGVGESIDDLFGSEQHADGDRRIGRDLRLVYGQLRRNGCWHRRFDNRQPDFDDDLLRALENSCGNSTCQTTTVTVNAAACSADLGERQSVHDLFWREQHSDGDRWVRHNLRLVHRKLRRNGGWNWNIDNRQPDFDHDLLRPLGE